MARMSKKDLIISDIQFLDAYAQEMGGRKWDEEDMRVIYDMWSKYDFPCEYKAKPPVDCPALADALRQRIANWR